jgi:hypothetical protein
MFGKNRQFFLSRGMTCDQYFFQVLSTFPSVMVVSSVAVLFARERPPDIRAGHVLHS